MTADATESGRGRWTPRLWMAGLWLFFVAAFFGYNLWKVPGYAVLYEGAQAAPLPAMRILVEASDFVRRFWVAALLLLLMPLVPILGGRLDRKASRFTVVMILLAGLLVTLYSISFELPEVKPPAPAPKGP